MMVQQQASSSFKHIPVCSTYVCYWERRMVPWRVIPGRQKEKLFVSALILLSAAFQGTECQLTEGSLLG
jgi:hypothetical protein